MLRRRSFRSKASHPKRSSSAACQPICMMFVWRHSNIPSCCWWIITSKFKSKFDHFGNQDNRVAMANSTITHIAYINTDLRAQQWKIDKPLENLWQPCSTAFVVLLIPVRHRLIDLASFSPPACVFPPVNTSPELISVVTAHVTGLYLTQLNLA